MQPEELHIPIQTIQPGFFVRKLAPTTRTETPCQTKFVTGSNTSTRIETGRGAGGSMTTSSQQLSLEHADRLANRTPETMETAERMMVTSCHERFARAVPVRFPGLCAASSPRSALHRARACPPSATPEWGPADPLSAKKTGLVRLRGN